ncbi:MAG: 30S ribosomal protein S4, partial [Candidatus Woesearchaeota archaeon]|nr:30S ribosomal protein S4 [Candidatus Woesearchaeota archaeon]
MGDPRRMKSKIDRPSHPWDKTRIEEESVLSAEYGLRNKKELWRMHNTLRGFTTQAKNLIAS